MLNPRPKHFIIIQIVLVLFTLIISEHSGSLSRSGSQRRDSTYAETDIDSMATTDLATNRPLTIFKGSSGNLAGVPHTGGMVRKLFNIIMLLFSRLILSIDIN